MRSLSRSVVLHTVKSLASLLFHSQLCFRPQAFAYYANMLQYPHVPEVPTSPQGYSANFFGPVPSASWQHHQIAMAYYQPFQPQSYFFG